MPSTAVYFVLPSSMARMPAALIWSGVSKSGSPAPRPITSRPAAFSSCAFVVTAMVGEGFTRDNVADRSDIAASGLNSPDKSHRLPPKVDQGRSPERDEMTTDTNDSWFDPDATTFGDRVAGARERAGMTQGDLAKRLGVKLKTLKAWEGDGPDTPAVGDLSPDISEMLTEIRDIRAQLAFSTDRLGRIEKSLRAKLREEAGE